jgi:hypothetical protein
MTTDHISTTIMKIISPTTTETPTTDNGVAASFFSSDSGIIIAICVLIVISLAILATTCVGLRAIRKKQAELGNMRGIVNNQAYNQAYNQTYENPIAKIRRPTISKTQINEEDFHSEPAYELLPELPTEDTVRAWAGDGSEYLQLSQYETIKRTVSPFSNEHEQNELTNPHYDLARTVLEYDLASSAL